MMNYGNDFRFAKEANNKALHYLHLWHDRISYLSIMINLTLSRTESNVQFVIETRPAFFLHKNIRFMKNDFWTYCVEFWKVQYHKKQVIKKLLSGVKNRLHMWKFYMWLVWLKNSMYVESFYLCQIVVRLYDGTTERN